jgi:MFS family permease
MRQIEAVPSWRELAATGQLAKFTLLCLGVWLHAADSLLAATVMPAAVSEIGGVVFINWALALYQLGSILAAAATGSVTARIGLRSGLMMAAALYALGCVASAIAPEIAMMLVGRLLQGLGGGGMMALVYVALHEIFPERFWPRLMVIVSTIWGCSALCGPLVGGLFAEAGLWRWAFWAFAGQAAILIVAAVFLPSRRTAGAGGWAPWPLLLLVLGTIGIAAAGATVGTGWPVLLGAGGLGLLYAFARLDRRQAHRMLPVEALDLRHPVGAGLLMVLALSAATTPFGTYGPLLLGVSFGIGPLAAGYLVAVEAIAWTLASIVTASAAAQTEGRLIRYGAPDRSGQPRLRRGGAGRVAARYPGLPGGAGRRVRHGLGLYGQAHRRRGARGRTQLRRRLGLDRSDDRLCRRLVGQRRRRQCRRPRCRSHAGGRARGGALAVCRFRAPGAARRRCRARARAVGLMPPYQASR